MTTFGLPRSTVWMLKAIIFFSVFFFCFLVSSLAQGLLGIRVAHSDTLRLAKISFTVFKVVADSAGRQIAFTDLIKKADSSSVRFERHGSFLLTDIKSLEFREFSVPMRMFNEIYYLGILDLTGYILYKSYSHFPAQESLAETITKSSIPLLALAVPAVINLCAHFARPKCKVKQPAAIVCLKSGK